MKSCSKCKKLPNLVTLAVTHHTCPPHHHHTPVSVTRLKKYFSIIRPFITMKKCQMATKNPKVGSKIGQTLNKPSKNYQIPEAIGQSGEISLSLITLTLPRRPANYPLLWPGHQTFLTSFRCGTSVTRSGDLLDFGQILNAFGNT